MGLNAGVVRFHLRRENLKDFIEKQSKKRSVYFLKLPKMRSLFSIYNLYLICLLVWSFLILFSDVNDFPKRHARAKMSLVNGRSLPFGRVKVDGFNKMTA